MATNINADTTGGLKLTSDTSGQLELQSAGSTKVTITSGGTVGIGTTTPIGNLHIDNPTGNVLIRASSSDSDIAGIDFGDVSDFDAGRIRYYNTDDSLRFSTVAIERMRINANGYVTKPNQCYFRVRTNTGSTAQTGLIPWTEEVVDIGNNFASNQFTAPVDGNYFFAHNNLAGANGNVNNDVSLYVNGVAEGGTRVREDSGTANWVSYQIVAILNLSANDVVDVRVTAGAVYAASTTWTSFYGYLLG